MTLGPILLKILPPPPHHLVWSRGCTERNPLAEMFGGSRIAGLRKQVYAEASIGVARSFVKKIDACSCLGLSQMQWMNDHWSSAVGLSVSKYTKPWHTAHRLLPCIIRELRIPNAQWIKVPKLPNNVGKILPYWWFDCFDSMMSQNTG